MSDAREFRAVEVDWHGTAFSLRIRWVALPGHGALRLRDELHWEGARQCRTCRTLGYDHGNVDAVLEAHRLGLDHAPHVNGRDCPPCARRQRA